MKKSSISLSHNPESIDQPRLGIRMFSYALVSVIATLLGGVLFRAGVYRTIGPYETGVLALSLSVITVAGTFASLGIPVAIVKFLASRSGPAEGASYLVTGAIMILAHSVLVVLVLGGLFPTITSWLKTPHLLDLKWAILLGVFLSAFLSFSDRAYNGLLRLDMTAGMNLTNNIVKVLCGLVLVYWVAATAEMGLIATLIGYLCATLWGINLLIKSAWQYGREFSIKSHAKELYPFGIYQFGAIALDQVIYNAGIFLTARFLTPAEVGLYSTAVLLAQVVWVIPSAIQMITYPVMSKYWSQQDKAALNRMVSFCVRVSLAVLTPFVFCLFYLRIDIISLIFGSSFLGAASPLSILLIGYLFNAVISRPLGASMGAIDRPAMDMVRVGIAATVNLACSVLLIPSWGLQGAAWAMTFTLITTSCISQTFLVKLSGISFPWDILRIITMLAFVATLLISVPITTVGGRLIVTLLGFGLLSSIGWIWGMTGSDKSYIISRMRELFPVRA